MASPNLPDALRGLVLSAEELRRLLPEAPDAFIEDYLNIIYNLLAISTNVNQKQDRLRSMTLVTSADSPYTPLSTDDEILFNTNAGDIVCNLPAGANGRKYRLISIGENGNKVNVVPFGAEEIFGDTSEYIYDLEALIISYSSEAGGWN